MPEMIVGRVRPNYTGVWDATKTYAFYDWVFLNGSSYICINHEGAPAGAEITNGAYWILMAQKGDTPTTTEIQTIIDSMNIDAGTLSGKAPDYYRCANGCSWTCSSGCTGGCGNGCTGGCLAGCTGGCSSCTGSCTGSCSTTCTGGCTGCTGTCSGSCTSCTGSCSGGCSSCTGTCSTSCSSCVGTCTGSATCVCGRNCAGGCENNN